MVPQGLLHLVYARRRHIERSALLARLEHGALYDALTGLPNRYLFSDRLNVSMARQARDRAHRFAVCFVDLDRFKISMTAMATPRVINC